MSYLSADPQALKGNLSLPSGQLSVSNAVAGVGSLYSASTATKAGPGAAFFEAYAAGAVPADDKLVVLAQDKTGAPSAPVEVYEISKEGVVTFAKQPVVPASGFTGLAAHQTAVESYGNPAVDILAAALTVDAGAALSPAGEWTAPYDGVYFLSVTWQDQNNYGGGTTASVVTILVDLVGVVNGTAAASEPNGALDTKYGMTIGRTLALTAGQKVSLTAGSSAGLTTCNIATLNWSVLPC